MKEIRLLTKDEIEVKVKQVGEKGAQALLYKTSRVDMAILDEIFGITNWTNEYRDIDGVLYCGIGIRESGDKPFVWKWSNGIESRSDGEGNEVKGEASDALKRAGFLCGIGRELYTAPFIFLNVETQPQTDKEGKKIYKNGKLQYELKDRYAKYKVDEIEYNADRSIKRVVISDKDGNIVYGANRAYKKSNVKYEPHGYDSEDIPDPQPKKTVPAKTTKEEDFDTVPNAKPNKVIVPETINAEVVNDIEYLIDRLGAPKESVMEWINTRYKKTDLFALTIDEANRVVTVLSKRIKEKESA